MRTFYKSIVFLFLAFFPAVADSASDNKKISVYLHPVTLLVGADAKGILFYSTVEIPMSLYNAPIIKPSLWKGQDIIRVGSDFGLRHYLAGRGEGLYLQPQAGAFYLSAKAWSFDMDYRKNDGKLAGYKKEKGTWFDGMLYLGNAYKYSHISIYSDSGIGYGCILGECTIIYDANIGLGISF